MRGCACSAFRIVRSRRSRGPSSPVPGSPTSRVARRSRRSTGRGRGQLAGAGGAVTAESAEANERALWLAETLGLRPFALADDARALYHAGAAIASNFLVTLHRAAAELFEQAGVPTDALVPLMERTIENGFE